MLIVFAGPACSGKSTLAAEVARRRGWPHLSMDATRQRIMPGAAHTRADRAVAYRAMHFAAELLVDAGAAAVLDAPYGHPEDRAEMVRVSKGDYRLIEVHVAIEVALARLRARGIPDPTRPDLNEELLTQLYREYPYSNEGLRIDTDKLAPEEALRKIEAWLLSR